MHIVSAYTDPESSGPAENGQEGIKKPGTKSTETGQRRGELPHGTIALFFLSFLFICLFVYYRRSYSPSLVREGRGEI